MTPGYRTTEFWLSLIAVLLSTALASGLLGEGDAARIAAAVLAALTALGYTAARSRVKTGGPLP